MITSYRRDLHKIPELGFCEYKTSEYIYEHLIKYKCEITRIGTGILAYFDNKSKYTISFRADMDGLKIFENSDKPYKSIHTGIMHACGHDGHMAILLGLADYLATNDKVNKNILLIFQPSEEENAGAQAIVESGAIEKYNVKEIYGLHIWPSLGIGEIYTMPGAMMAHSGEVDINIIGQESHVASKQFHSDSLEIAAKLISIFYKRVQGNRGVLLRCGRLNSGTARNIIPGKAKMEFTVRGFNDRQWTRLVNYMKEVCRKIAKKRKVDIDIKINDCYPTLINDTQLYKKIVKKIDNVNWLKKPVLQAEDFSRYSKACPSLFFFLGTGESNMLHTNSFDFDEQILYKGLELFKKIVAI